MLYAKIHVVRPNTKQITISQLDLSVGKECEEKSLGQKIRMIRETLKLSRREFAQLLDVSECTLKNYELGYREVSGEMIVKLCRHDRTSCYAMWLLN